MRMIARTRRWLFLAAAAVSIVLIGLAWSAIQADRGSNSAHPVPTVTSRTNTGQVPPNGEPATPRDVRDAPTSGPDGTAFNSPLNDWWQRVPPVAGNLIWIDRYAEGRVRVDRERGRLVVHFEDLTVGAYDSEVRSVRVLLSAGTVVGEHRGYWSQMGAPYDVGDIPADQESVSIAVPSPSKLPDEVRSLILVDVDTGKVLGGAPLLPTA